MAGQHRITFESWFERPLAEVWPVISDTNRGNEITDGMSAYTAEDVLGADGSVRRHARGRMGPVRAEWVEGFGEWVENRYLRQVRHYIICPLRSLTVEFRTREERGGTRVESIFEATWDSLLGTAMVRLGILDRALKKLVLTAETAVATQDGPDRDSVAVPPPELDDAQAERLERCVAEIEAGPFGHGLARRLAEYLSTAPVVDVRRLRPLVLARHWDIPAETAVELCVAVQRAGLADMRWAVLCPRCRGAKSEPGNLYELPRGVHCESCNIDFERNFSQNVELVFGPAGWLRDLPLGEFCMMGAASTPHVKLQRQVEPGEAVSERLSLAAGGYRLRTVEAGGQCDVDCDGGAFPEFIARDGAIAAGPPAEPGTVTLRNDGQTARTFVIEERAWTADVLTGPRVIAMRAFRDLCPEQVLRPGDDVAIGRIAILFTDLKGSTALYAAIGDSTAYGLVRDHFAFLVDKVHGHHGVLVKTMGDAVMAAFEDPANAVRAALAMQRDVAAFNAGHAPAEIVVKLGLHQGSCIAVTTGGNLDYFGTTVNIAARLQGQSRGGDMVLSAAIVADPAAGRVLADTELRPESAVLHGFTRAETFYRVISPAEDAGRDR